jgi:NADP-dependent 3-hydroxy acid dehydrogenase YdfG
MSPGTAVVTGASSGIGMATARSLSREGFDVVVGARREDRLRTLADEIGGRAIRLDVTDPASVESFCREVPDCRLLVNAAGGAIGRDRIEDSSDEDWRVMYESNVMGSLRMTRALLPALEASGDGHVVMVGSIAGYESYIGGGGYNAAKFAVRAMTKVLRLELLGRPIRITEIDPGLVKTEFSVVRFRGDQRAADAVYEGITPLTAEDVAECIVFAVTRPSHVNIDALVVLARDQSGAATVHRRTS